MYVQVIKIKKYKSAHKIPKSVVVLSCLKTTTYLEADFRILEFVLLKVYTEIVIRNFTNQTLQMKN